MTKPTVIVIGAGIGGIATAARLAQRGYQVTVFEKNEHPGGRCDRMVIDGHHFDTGPTLFLMADLYAKAFADLGERMEDHLDLQRIDPTYHIHFHDGSQLNLSSDLSEMYSQLEAIEPGSFDRYLEYLRQGYRHYHLAMKHLVNRNFNSPKEFYTLKNLVLFFRIKALKNHFRDLGKYFKEERLKMAFSFQNMYMGLNPCQAPAIYSLLQYTELVDGIWYPMGGMHKIIDALADIAKRNGVKFIFNTPVKQININDRHATGVILPNGQKKQAEILVANADLPYVYRSLLPNGGKTDQLDRKKYGCSAMIFYWGLNKCYHQLGPHNLFLQRDYRQSFDPIFDEFTLPAEPNFYIHAPSRIDSSMAPEGQDTLMVAFPVGTLNNTAPQNWPVIKKRARRTALQGLAKIGITDLDEQIKFEVIYTPLDWQNRYNLYKGSAHGLGHNILQMGYFRPPNRHPKYKNLYFVGASTHPGTGLPTVLVSSSLTVERILQDTNVL